RACFPRGWRCWVLSRSARTGPASGGVAAPHLSCGRSVGDPTEDPFADLNRYASIAVHPFRRRSRQGGNGTLPRADLGPQPPRSEKTHRIIKERLDYKGNAPV